MPSKKLYYLAGFIGTTLGGLIPALWGGSLFSFTSLLLGGVVGVLAIVLVYKFY